MANLTERFENGTDFRGVLSRVRSQSGINQIRGTNVAGSTGSGIPQHVTNVSAVMANASTGATSTVTVTFNRNPADSAFAGVNVLVKGYQGNQTATQIAAGADSPVKFILNNTSEALSFSVQAYGNGGNAPLSTAPTVGVTLPKNTTGGVGTTTVTSLPAVASGSAGQLAKISGFQVVGTELTGDVTTNGSPATSVVAIRGKSVSTKTPIDGDILRWSVVDSDYEIVMNPDWLVGSNGTSGAPLSTWPFQSTAWVNAGTISQDIGTATELPGTKYTSSSTATSIAGFIGNESTNPTCYLGIVRRCRFRIKLAVITNVRLWFGMTTGTSSVGAGYEADIPNFAIVGFRFSTHAGDTKIQAVCQGTGGVGGNQTLLSTGVSADTSVHEFDFVYNGTNVQFYVDGVSVGSIATNIPPTNAGMAPFLTVDNVATANAQGCTFFYAKGTLVKASL